MELVEIHFRGKDDLSGAVEQMTRAVGGLHASILKFAAGNLLAGGVAKAAAGIADFGKSLIDSNAAIETTKLRLTELYGSATEAAQAFAFLKQNELTVPFSIEDIMAATTSLVAFRQNITTLLPAMENIAGALGQPLQRVAKAFDAAFAGRFAMLRNIGISKAELAAAGAQINTAGHLTDPSSLATAMINIADHQFKNGAQKMSQTWAGLMSSMKSQWFYLTANLGQGAFTVLEQQLHGVVHTLQDPANAKAIQAWEQGIGNALGRGVAAAIQFAQTIGPYVGSAIIVGVRAWKYFDAALGVVGDNLGKFITYLGRNMGGAMQAFGAYFSVMLPIVTTEWATALDLLSGNWGKFQQDLNQGATYIAGLLVDLFAGIEESVGYKLGKALLGPFTTAAQGIRQLVKEIGGVVGALVGGTVGALYDMGTKITQVINRLIDGFNAVSSKLHLPTIPKLFDPEAENAKRFVATRDYNIWGLNHQRPAGFVGPWNPWANYKGPMPQAQIQNPGATMQQQITDWFGKNAPGIDPGQKYVPGVTQAQFIADMEAKRKQILHDLGLDKGKPGATPYYDPGKAGPGGDILTKLDDLFKGLGGKMTLADFARLIGIQIGKAPGAGAFPNLPVNTPYGDTAGGAAGAAGALARASALSPRITPGQLGATFMSTIATTGQLGKSDPQAREMAKQSTLQEQMASSTKVIAQASTTMVATLASVARSSEQTRDLLSRGALPLPAPGNPARQMGAARPGRL